MIQYFKLKAAAKKAAGGRQNGNMNKFLASFAKSLVFPLLLSAAVCGLCMAGDTIATKEDSAKGDIFCYTWNMEWFPFGKDDQYKAKADERIKAAGDMLYDAVRTLQENSSQGEQIFFLQEINSQATCSKLISHLKRPGLRLASISSFYYGKNKDKQQIAILTTLPVLEKSFERWRNEDGIKPPRGFTYALLDGKDSYIACFGLHLKANGAEEELSLVKQQRETSSRQLLRKIKEVKESHTNKTVRVIIAGDFNTNVDDKKFLQEDTLRSLYAAHYRSCFRDLKPKDRVTHPGRGRHQDATFDYILYKDFPKDPVTKIFPGTGVSDHHIVGSKFE